LPFSKFFRHVSKRVRYQPVRAVSGFVVVCIIFGLLCLINSTAAQALFSLFVASNYVAWGVPIACRLVWGKERFSPGEFYTGVLSRPIATVACVWLVFGLVLSMFPVSGPDPTRTSSPCHSFSLPLYACAIELTIFSRKHELHDQNHRREK
jgi:amino acid transporter